MLILFFECLLSGLLLIIPLTISSTVHAQSNSTPVNTHANTVTHTSSPQSHDLRVLSWNLYNRPWSRAARLENVKRTLIERAPDLVALQEVSTGWLLPGDPMQAFSKIFSGYYSAREWHESNLGIFKTGLGLWSRWPLKDVKYTEFNHHPFWDSKGFYQARVEIPAQADASSLTSGVTSGKSLHWFNVHLASTKDTEMQQKELDQLERAIRDCQKRLPEVPILISGDWNIEWKSPMLQSWIQKMQADSLFSHLPDDQIHVTWSQNYKKTCAFTSEVEKGEVIDHMVWIQGQSHEPGLVWASGSIGMSPLVPHPSDHCYVESTFSF